MVEATMATKAALAGAEAGRVRSQALREEEESKKMEMWEKVCVSDPKYVKKVNTRGGFNTPCAQSQIMAATKLWGPMGYKWGVEDERVDSPKNMAVVKVTVWYPHAGEKCSVSQYGGSSWMNDKDTDALKKARTDGTTKCLSLLGFNADIFLGLWDDSKYVAEVQSARDKFGSNAGAEFKAVQKEIFSMARHLPLQQQAFINETAKDLTFDEWNDLHKVACLMKDSFELMGVLPDEKRDEIEKYMLTIKNTRAQWLAIFEKLDLLVKEAGE